MNNSKRRIGNIKIYSSQATQINIFEIELHLITKRGLLYFRKINRFES